MSHWNDRIVLSIDDYGMHSYSIKEFYYHEDGSIMGWTENDKAPWGESVEELKEVLTWMLAACDKPIIDQTELDAIVESYKD